MTERFPSQAFFGALKKRIEEESALFQKLGIFDVSFGVHVLPSDGAPERLVVLDFDTYACASAREVARAPETIDFVLEAPYGVWRAMLASLDAKGAVDAGHTINTLTHHDDPMRVTWSDPVGHDKLFRFQESIQMVFDLAARVEGRAVACVPR